MEYAVETKNISKNFVKDKGLLEFIKNPFEAERIIALKNVSIKIKYGELYGLLGLNGAGKTTLLKILSSLILPDSGSAFIEGMDVVKKPNVTKYSIGLVYGEERSFYWRLTGRQNLEFYSSLYNIPRDHYIDYLFKVVGLNDKIDFRVDSYSTGMKHRLAIARGLIGNPPILLMDDPTLGVDPLGAEKIQDFIRGLVDKEGKTILLVTHDLKEAVNLCDTVSILHKGEIRTTIQDVRRQKPELINLFKECCWEENK